MSEMLLTILVDTGLSNLVFILAHNPLLIPDQKFKPYCSTIQSLVVGFIDFIGCAVII